MNEKSEQLQNSLNSIRSDIESEKDRYINKCSMIQKTLSFDIYDKRLLSKLSDSIQKMNDANSTYYAYLQLKLEETNNTAAKYSLDELDYEVVENVYHLIQFINSESTIENVLDGSINKGFASYDLGSMAVITYSPSLQAKKIELRWKEAMDKMPESKRKESIEKKNSEKQDKADYHLALARWKRSCLPIDQKRKAYVDEKIKEEFDGLAALQQEQYDRSVNELNDKISSITNEIHNEEDEMKHLGIFKRKEKKQLLTKIEELKHQVEEYRNSIIQSKKDFDKAMLEIPQEAKATVYDRAYAEAEKLYPYTPEPEKPDVVKKEELSRKIYLDNLLSNIITILVREDRPLKSSDIYKCFMEQKDRRDIQEAIRIGIDRNVMRMEKNGYIWMA